MSSKLNLGCGTRPLEGWVNLDVVPGDGVDVVADLDRCRTTPLPFPDESFDEFRALHVLEHLRDPLPFVEELYRIAKPDGIALIFLPYGSSDDAFEDPTHALPWFPRSFTGFAQVAPKGPFPGYRADWITEQIVLDVKAERLQGKTVSELLEEVDRFRNVVLQMRVSLRAHKPARAAAVVSVAPPISFNAI